MKFLQIFSLITLFIGSLVSCKEEEVTRIEKELGLDEESIAADEKFREEARARDKKALEAINSLPPATSSFGRSKSE